MGRATDDVRRSIAKQSRQWDVGDDNRVEGLLLTGRGANSADIRVGDLCDLEGVWMVHDPAATIRVGSRSELNVGCVLDVLDRVEIGDDVLVAAEVYISDHDSHSLDWSLRQTDHLDRRRGARDWTLVPCEPVRIENKAWIGRRSMILKGVVIGEGAVVAAGSVVTRSVPAWTMVAGVPASEVRTLEPR